MRYVGENVNSFEKDDLVLLGPNLPHCWKNTDDNEETAKSIVIQWPKNLLGNGWLQKGEFRHIKQLFDKAEQGVRFNKKIPQDIQSTLKELVQQDPFDKLLSTIHVLDSLAKTEDYELLTDNIISYNLSGQEKKRINRAITMLKNIMMKILP